MLLLEVLPPKVYGEPKGDVRWNIDHPKFKLYPELQDAIWNGYKTLSPPIQKLLLQQYGLGNMSHIHFLPLPKLTNLLKDIESYNNSLLRKQAGYVPGDEVKYPTSGRLLKKQAD